MRWLSVHRRPESGDTIVEVVLALTILGLILGASSVVANRNTRSLQDTQERSVALRLAQSQTEKIRAGVALPVGVDFCVPEGEAEYSTDSDECTVTNGGASYRQVMRVGSPPEAGSGYIAKISIQWESLHGYSSTVDLEHRFYAQPFGGGMVQGVQMIVFDDDGLAENIPSVITESGNECSSRPGYQGEWPICTEIPPPPPPSCPAGYTGPGQPNCTERKQPTLAGDGTYPTWHLSASQSYAGVARAWDVRIPAGSAPVRITSLTTTNPSNFRITSTDCANRTLSAGQSCRAWVEFKPTGAAAVNRLNNASNHPDHGNSAIRNGALVVNNDSRLGAVSASLQGKTVSNVMLPGDVMFMGSRIRSYDPNCYNNADACGWVLVMQGDANWVLYEPQAQGGRARWFTGQQPTGTWAQMQVDDGHIVEYRETWPGSRGQPGGSTVVWAPHNTNRSAGDYLALHNSGHLEMYSNTGAHKLYIFVP